MIHRIGDADRAEHEHEDDGHSGGKLDIVSPDEMQH
jgi:hypothetical protein